jgi:trans-2,3-dihydro-3-hydroxyanthranilate isomerase
MTASSASAVFNAFSVGPFSGNPAGIVFNGGDLSPELMQAIARQFNLVETVFVTELNVKESTARLRYFTPAEEVPIAGHPTIAAFSALRTLGYFEQNIREAWLLNEQERLRIIYQDNTVFMEQLPAQEIKEEINPQEIFSIFGLTKDDMIADLPIKAFNLGLGHLIVPIKKLQTLLNLVPNRPALLALCQRLGVRESQLFTFETLSGKATLHTRNIEPTHVRLEDPACGNGNAALGAYIFKYVTHLAGQTLCNEQGHNVNMPSEIQVVMKKSAAGEDRIFIGGHVWCAMTGALHIS